MESGWTPDQIGKLTLIQIACRASDKPLGRGTISSPAELEQIAAAKMQW
jgi:hypothetical protein